MRAQKWPQCRRDYNLPLQCLHYVRAVALRQSQRREALAALPMGYVTICPDYSLQEPPVAHGTVRSLPGRLGLYLARSTRAVRALPPPMGPGGVHYRIARRLLSCTHSSQLSPCSDRPGVTLAARPFPVTAPSRTKVNTSALLSSGKPFQGWATGVPAPIHI